MGKYFGTVSFRQKINSIIEKKIGSIDPGNVETIVVFDAIPLQFPKNFIINSNTINNERASFAAQCLKRTL